MIGIFLGIFIFLGGAFFLQGLRRIPADPPSRAVVTRFGTRTGRVKNEGWRFFPICPWFHGYILVDMTKKNLDLIPEEVRTAQDMAEIEVAVSLTWRPDSDLNPVINQSYLLEYLNSGGKDGVENIMKDIVEEAVREFAADPNRRPNTWEDAVTMKREFLAEIVAAILGEIPSQVSEEDIDEIVVNLRRGNGNLKLETLGIVLNRVNVTRIMPKGKLAEAAEKEAVEKRERLAEVIELNHIGERINALKALGFSNEQALEIIQNLWQNS